MRALPDGGLVGQDVAIILDSYGSSGALRAFFHIALICSSWPQRAKESPAHTVVAGTIPAVRVGKADAIGNLSVASFNGERRELTFFLRGGIPAEHNGKVNCRKGNGSGKNQPRCVQQKCVPILSDRLEKRRIAAGSSHRHDCQTQRAAHRLLAAKKLIANSPISGRPHKHDKRGSMVCQIQKGKENALISVTFFHFFKYKVRWYSSSSSFFTADAGLRFLTKAEGRLCSTHSATSASRLPL